MRTRLYTSPRGILTLIFSLALVSCPLLFGNQNQTENVSISYSGLSENKYISGQISGQSAEVTLYAKTAKFVAVVETAAKSTSTSYNGYFVYNQNQRTAYLYFTSSRQYQKASVVLSGTNGSVSSSPATARFSTSSQTEFNSAVTTVASLSPSTDTNTGDSTKSSDGTKTEVNTNPKVIPVTPLPLSSEKTLSDYEDGVRQLNFGERDDKYDTIFVSTIQPRPRPDYTPIDNLVANLIIPTTESIENAAKAIIAVLPEDATVKEKARAIFAWVALHIDYDYSYKNASYTKEGAFTNRKAVCGGYSALMAAMGKAVDIECEERVGNIASGSGKFKIGALAHAWNIVYDDSAHTKGFLLDVTWASQGTLESGKSIDEEWFDPDPCYFVTTHWAEKEASLVGRTITRDEFYTLPVLYPRWEQYGIDGKELLEFCWSHNISSVVDFDYLYSGTNVLQMPVSMVDMGTNYQYAFERNGESVTGTFNPSPSASKSEHCLVNFKKAGTMSYVISDLVEEDVVDYSQPKWILYDDKIEFEPLSNSKSEILLDNGWCASYDWNTTQPFSVRFYDNAEVRSTVTCVATWDAVYQQWSEVKGRMIMGTYDSGLTAEEKAEQDAVLVHALQQVIKKIDPSIPLDRMGDYTKADFNVVYVPLSKEQEFKDSIINYDWYQDEEFREFVYWMEMHNIPESQIDFYKLMARYPMNRGGVVHYNYFEGLTEVKFDRRYTGFDVAVCPWPLYEGDVVDKYYAGGMQYYFELRKHDTRRLFNNKKIPILILSVRNSDTENHQILPENYFEDFGENLKRKFCAAGLDREYEIEFAEISLSYDEFQKTYFPETHPGTGDGKWVFTPYLERIKIGNEALFEKLREVNPSFAEKYSDDTKTAMIKIFSDQERVANDDGYHSLNYKTGLCIAEVSDTDLLLYYLLYAIGYHWQSHNYLFGSLLKSESPGCFAMNCVRDDAICPLCLYSFGID